MLLGKLQSNQDKVLIDGNPLEIQDMILTSPTKLDMWVNKHLFSAVQFDIISL